MIGKMFTTIKIIFILATAMTLGITSLNAGENVKSGFGTMSIKGLVQFWYEHDNVRSPKDFFRIRRTEIRLSGTINPIVAWTVMIDPATIREDNLRNSLLQDAQIILTPFENWTISAGQFIFPFGLEGLMSSARLDFAERSMLTTKLNWANFRDIGFTIRHNIKLAGIEIQPTIGLLNGERLNRWDLNESMDFIGRLVVSPTEHLHFAVAHYNGWAGANETRSLWSGVELMFTQDKFTVYGEFAAGKNAGININNFYLSGTYNFFKNLQLALRYDYLDHNSDTPLNAVTEKTIGLNYFIEGHNSKLQLNYIFRGEEGTSINNDGIRFNLQTAF
ncbi:MAG: hypothetical protein C0425_04450 [Chlorobiaceae bacterium]|nr:hypothetical protein [Chlorobiaceae bacterium]MBA4309567.1 hypothetical protein [Chlorobiaceae bacterium]